MDEFKITNLEGLLDYCNELNKACSGLNELMNNLEQLINKVNSMWENDNGSDKAAYIREVRSCIKFLNDISKSGIDFADQMEVLHNETQAIQSNSLDLKGVGH